MVERPQNCNNCARRRHPWREKARRADTADEEEMSVKVCESEYARTANFAAIRVMDL